MSDQQLLMDFMLVFYLFGIIFAFIYTFKWKKSFKMVRKFKKDHFLSSFNKSSLNRPSQSSESKKKPKTKKKYIPATKLYLQLQLIQDYGIKRKYYNSKGENQ